jgi:hypothetical protein
MNAGKSIIQVSFIFIFLVLMVGCAPKPTPAPQTGVEVTNITESSPVTGEITQTKTFNQCDAAGSLKVVIQFNDSASESNQQELVLGGSVTGGANVSGVAKVELQASIQKHFSSIKSSGTGHSESVDIEVPAHARQEYTITWKETRREGTIEYKENGETKSTNYSYRVGLEFASSSVKKIDCSLPTETPLPATSTPAPVVESTPTLQTRTLVDNCIFSQTWKLDSIDQNNVNNASVDSNSCYSIEPLGIFADGQGTLHMYKRDRKSLEASGIFTPITNYSVIGFNVFVNSMYIVYSDNPAYVSFAVAPVNSPMSTKDAARFNLQVQSAGKNPFVLFALADAGESSSTPLGTQHYEHNRTYKIQLELKGGVMDVYINGVKMNESLAIPDGSKVLYIGYSLPVMAGMDVEISNLRVDGVLK